MNVKVRLPIVIILIFIVLTGCKQKSVKLPTLGVLGIQDTIYNNSKIWFFYKLEGNDTIAEINKNNKLANTHWLFNIDKRLTIKQIIPTIKKLQEKKAEPSIHDNGETTHLYYSYVDTVSNKLSMVLFDSVSYTTTKKAISLQDGYKHIQLAAKNDAFYIDSKNIALDTLQQHLQSQLDSVKLKVHLNIDKNIKYQKYLYLKATLQNIKNDSIRIDLEEIVE